MEFRVPVAVTHVVHIGAGFGSDVPTYVADELSPIVLIEADPEACAHLKALEACHPELQVIQSAVSGQLGPRIFYGTNFSELNSLSRPSGLQKLFPGLQLLSEDSMEAVAVNDLLEELGLPQTGGLLVLEAPGEALKILQALSSAQWTEAFSVIRVQEGRHSLYEDVPALEEIRYCLCDMGYQVWEDSASEDPDRPYLLGLRGGLADEATAKVQALTQALQHSQNTVDVLCQERDQARSDLVEELERNTNAGQQILGLNSRTQALQEAELQELQRRFMELHAQKAEQDRLLQRLSVSLGQLLEGAPPVAKTTKADGASRKTTNPSDADRSAADSQKLDGKE